VRQNIKEAWETVMATPSAPILEVTDLVKRYNGAARPALDGLSLKVRPGEILGLLGPNGAGKTTAVSIISTILRPSSGRVTVCGIDLWKTPRRARPHIGLVPQEIALYAELTAWENLAFFGRLQALRGARLKERMASALAAVGLEAKAHQKIATFSGGMQRRINLAVGILHAPRLLLLDEPTVGIDPQSRQLILEKLQTIKQEGTAMLYTTHYMEEAQQLCDRVAIMDNGRILCQGPPQDLISAQAPCCSLGELFLHLTGKELRD
jgi:ABC-2 type transport system ATP-binding protein